MVSSLMNSICRPETAALGLETSTDAFDISGDSEAKVARAIGTWDFSAHDFSDDELLHAAYIMLTHCLQCSELEQWRQSGPSLKRFLLASRAAYNNFVPYHNFRHVVDVLQALFFSLLQVGILPPYPHGKVSAGKMPASAISALLEPFDALVLLVSAIGHDVGHPGVSNAFLVMLKSPLAQLYNDKSVLEAFHCAAYSQIPAAGEDPCGSSVLCPLQRVRKKLKERQTTPSKNQRKARLRREERNDIRKYNPTVESVLTMRLVKMLLPIVS